MENYERIIYFDYDGVFGNTISVAVEEMKRLGMYEHEEDRRKYYSELNWAEFLIKAGFMKNAIKAINILIEKGYKVKFLTHTNSLPEHEDKINFIKGIKELKHPESIDIITVPRKVDKSFAIDPRGHILLDDRLHNVTTWEEAGGIGILFSEEKGLYYKTISDPMELVDYVLKRFPIPEKKEEYGITDYKQYVIDKYLKEYMNSVNTFMIYNRLLKDGIIFDSNDYIFGAEEMLERLEYCCECINKQPTEERGFFLEAYELQVSKFFDKVYAETKDDRYIRVKELIKSYYSESNDNKETICRDVSKLSIYKYIVDILSKEKDGKQKTKQTHHC